MMPYGAEVERIAAEVESGRSLYALVASSAFVTEPEKYGLVLRGTDYADEYANMLEEEPPREAWDALSGHVVFFAMCADVRESLCD